MKSVHTPEKSAKLAQFDASGVGLRDTQLFGLPFTPEESDVVLLPAPWEVTVSYGEGTARAPEAIRTASLQVDLYDTEFPNGWQHGFSLLATDERWLSESDRLRAQVRRHLDVLSRGGPGLPEVVQQVNATAESFHQWVEEQTLQWLARDRLVGTVGGDHSTPLGLLRALAKRYPQFSILQLDAHADLRNAYEGFTYSHASIMHNALLLPQVQTLVQVGIRDICQEEIDRVREEGLRCLLYEMPRVTRSLYEGTSWKRLCTEIIEPLNQWVYISFDIDALEPHLCPSTGTPVPGGLDFSAAVYLLGQVVASGKKIIGFDLSEVGCSDATGYDSVVGARLLFRLCNLAAASWEG